RRLGDQRGVVRRDHRRGDVADLVHGLEGRRPLDEPRARRPVRAAGHPRERALPRDGRHAAAAAHLGRRPGGRAAAARAHHRQALAQFDQALPYANASPAVVERMRFPERAVMVSIPVRLDSGEYRVFAGYRVQHSTVLGPTKGGMRYDAEVTLGECAALAMWMTWKCALLRLPYGGAKGGVRCSPRALSIGELQRLTRRYTSELLPYIGPQEDIPAPDMATN